MAEFLKNPLYWVNYIMPDKKTPLKNFSQDVQSSGVLRNSLIGKSGRLLIRLIGISGVTAVILGAYGAHAFRSREGSEELKLAFETGNRYHMIHTIALFGVPFVNRPKLVGGLMISGMLLFSGSCYIYALTSNKYIRKVTPYGGMLLIAAWAAMIL